MGSWLWLSFFSFTDKAGAHWPQVLGPAVLAAGLAAAFGLCRSGPERMGAALLRVAGLAAAVPAIAYAAGIKGWLPVNGREALWLGAASAGLLWVLRLFYWRSARLRALRAHELLRWLAIGIAAVLAMQPFYFSGSIGAGDARWYVLMLSDFLTQLRAGVFPVWVGQSTYAFNGAVLPLRYAPGFQYLGGLMDLLTAQSLDFTALKNLCLATTAVLGALSAYACLRPITGRRPWIACILSILWICGPGVLAPLTNGDQYMTFMTLPFIPLVMHGCWRVWEFDDTWGRFWIAAGLAGLWLCHSPVGLWMSFISAAIYVAHALGAGRFRRELGPVAFMGIVFLVLGSLPFVSLLNLGNRQVVPVNGLEAAQEVHTYFPANFRPIDVSSAGLGNYQLGYALLGALAVSLLLMVRSRPRGAWAFAAASVMIMPFTVPVPVLTDAIWAHIPDWFVLIDNVWPMQRLFLIWSTLSIFTAAIVLGSEHVSGRTWSHAVAVGALAAGVLWSGHEAAKLGKIARRTKSTPQRTRVVEGPDNAQLGRYAYSSFEYAPGYASHGFMDAWFENRLLDRNTHRPFLSNADAEAPGDAPAAPYSNLVKKGAMTAENITESSYYFLRPDLALDPGRRYALRLEFLQPGIAGVLEIMHESMFREYILPDSGVNIGRYGPTLAFGSSRFSSKVISLIVSGKGPISPEVILITSRPTHDSFPVARYWLYSYDRSRLPIVVDSWIPYRVRFNVDKPAYLESPRMWQEGWRASVNGRRVVTRRSPENLVMVPVEPGANRVTLEYRPPAVLSASFWICFTGWLGLCTGAIGWLALARPAHREPI